MATSLADRGLVVLGVNLWEPQGTVKKYQNQYPNILMLKDPGPVWNIYKTQGYIPLNYVIGHDFKQTVEYNAEGFNHSAIELQVDNLLSDVSIKIHSQNPTYPPGTQLGLDVEFMNHVPSNSSFFALIEVGLPTGGYFPLYPVTLFTLDPSGTETLPLHFMIPTNVPLGTYNLRVYIGLTNLLYRESLDFEINT